ncbi:MAG TPA: zinc ribbon domain-containing protein [Candidatus Limnocylindria bacterium]|nr:zinc ribbon domain-containing protein [Candidatus Limnocylindria bacterium]
MPIFEYRCRRCDRQFESIVLSSRERISCPSCGSTAVEKQFSVFSARLSGNEATSPSSGACAGTPQTCGCHKG